MSTRLTESTPVLDPRNAGGIAEPLAGQRKRRLPRVRGRTVLLLAGLFGLVLLLGVLFGPEAQPVDTAAAEPATVIVTVSSEGKTRVKQEYDVGAPVAGHQRRVTLKAGDPVVANQTVLAIIDPPAPQFNDMRSQAELEAKLQAAESSLAQSQADLLRAKSQLDFAERDVIRYRDLAAAGVTAQRSMSQYLMEQDTRRSAMTIAQKMVDQRQAELDAAKAQLMGPNGTGAAQTAAQPVTVLAPVTGRVLDVQHESAGVVPVGEKIISVGDVKDIEIMLEMLSEDAVKVRPGMDANIVGWGGATLHARVRRVEPYSYTKISALGIEEQRVHVLLDFTDPPEKWQAIGHGYRVNGKVITWQGDGVLTLPMGALFRDGAQWAVYTIEDHVARLRHVELGHLNETQAEVLKGLNRGTEVILHPNDRIADGIPVRPRT